MDIVDHRQDQHELSMASLARLRILLRALQLVENRTLDALTDHERRRWKRSWPLWQETVRTDPLVVGSEYEEQARELIGAIEVALQKIGGRFSDERQRDREASSIRSDRKGEGDVWAVGAITFCVGRSPILRGEVELRRTEPIAAGIPDEVIAFLMAVPGTRDKITRENHGHWGYHYHYLDSKERRSDTLLTFDRSSANLASPTLCWERHAEGEKFKARAGMWGPDKRESVYSVCHPDTKRFKLVDFKRPAADAEVVWPPADSLAATSAA